MFRAKRSCKYCGDETWAFFNTMDEIFPGGVISHCPAQHFCSSKCLVLNEFSEMDKEKRIRILKKLNIQEPLESLDEELYEEISDLFFNGELS